MRGPSGRRAPLGGARDGTRRGGARAQATPIRRSAAACSGELAGNTMIYRNVSRGMWATQREGLAPGSVEVGAAVDVDVGARHVGVAPGGDEGDHVAEFGGHLLCLDILRPAAGPRAAGPLSDAAPGPAPVGA